MNEIDATEVWAHSFIKMFFCLADRVLFGYSCFSVDCCWC